MIEYEIEYAALRARNLSQELMLREENEIAKGDITLCASALERYETALSEKRVAKELGDMERSIIGRAAQEIAHNMRECNEYLLGPTDSELCSRALKSYGRELAASVRASLAEAA